MIVKATRNESEIKSILWDKDIYPLISGSTEITAEDVNLPDSVLYLAGYAPEIFAVSCFHKFKDGIKFHPNILPSYRLEHARDFIQKCLSMVKSPVYVEIPKHRKRLFNYALKIGFDSIPNNKDSSNTILMRLTWVL